MHPEQPQYGHGLAWALVVLHEVQGVSVELVVIVDGPQEIKMSVGWLFHFMV